MVPAVKLNADKIVICIMLLMKSVMMMCQAVCSSSDMQTAGLPDREMLISPLTAHKRLVQGPQECGVCDLCSSVSAQSSCAGGKLLLPLPVLQKCQKDI